MAQNGPGGVGTPSGSAGQPDNTVWLRAGDFSLNDGDVVSSDWTDAYGVSTTAQFVDNGANNITFVDNEVGGQPVLRFTAGDNFSVGNVADGTSTILIVSSDDGIRTAGGEDLITSDDENRSLTYYYEDDKNDLLAQLVSRGGNNKNNDLVSTSAASVTNFLIISANEDDGIGNQGEIDLFENGIDRGLEASSSSGITAGTIGDNLTGDIAEVIVFDDRLNAAQYEIVANYLSQKYGIPINESESAFSDLYTYDGYGFDVAGVGSTGTSIGMAASGDHTSATSSLVQITASGLSTGDFALFGHNGSSNSFISGSSVNGITEAQPLRRTWRTQLTGASTQTVDVNVDLSGLSLGTSFNDYILLVDADGDFTSGADIYDLNASGEASGVEIDDGSFVTIARVKRTVTFQTDLRTELESIGTPVINVSTNFPSSGSIGFDVQVQPDGSRPPATDGTDYNTDFATATSVTIPAGQTSVDLNNILSPSVALDVINDGIQEDDTEFVEITLANISSADAGDFTTLDFGIIDVDNPNEVTATANGSTTLSESSGGTFTVDVTSPVDGVDVTYEVTGTATEGSDYAASPSGAVNTLSFSSSGTQQITFNVLDDAVFETDESIVVTLLAVENTSSGTGATLAPTSRTVSFTITESTTAPTVSFQGDGSSEPTFTDNEGARLDLPVELSEAADVDVSVEFSVSLTGSASSSDISLVTSSPLVIPAGATSENIQVDLVQDGQEELNEDFTVTLTSASNAAITTDADDSARGIILDDDRIGSIGPGGVGDAENLVVWLDANTIDPNASSVSSWADRSENGNDASAGTAPGYTTSFANGEPGVTFDGTSQWMRIGGIASLPDGGNTLFFAASSNLDRTLFEQVSGDGKNVFVERSVFYGGSLFARANNGGTNTPGRSAGVGQPEILSTIFDGSVDMSVSGGSTAGNVASSGAPEQFAALGTSLSDSGSDPKIVELSPDGTSYFDGSVGEVIGYTAPLGSVQRDIVENYLSAKYDIALGNRVAVDYAGDTAANGDHDLDVFGVGFESPSNFHVSAQSGGLRYDNIEGLNSGDYLLSGHRVPDADNEIVSGSTNTTGVTIAAQVSREWYVDLRDSGDPTAVDVSFDLSEMGLGSSEDTDVGDETGYVLITRPQGGATWDDIATAVDVSGDRITFSGVNLTDGNVITLATTDQVVSPLSPVVLVITGQDGNEGDAARGTAGGDAGYRMIGPPIVPKSGGSFTGADLESDTDPQLIEFNLPFPMFYFWNDGTGAYEAPSATDDWANGRGALLYLLDDEGIPDADPIDPTIVITPTAGETAPTTDITVGDGSPAGDNALNTTATYHLLANPFASAFDGEALTAPSGAFVDDGVSSGSFQATLQAYDYASSSYVDFMVDDGTEDLLPVWQGFIVERSTSNSGNDDRITFPSTGRIFGSDASIIGSKSATRKVQMPRIELRLVATDGSGDVRAQDKAASIQFHPNASDGWDPYDATKFTPLATDYVTLAPIGVDRDGDRAPKAVESRPIPSQPVTVDLDINTVGVDGNFEIEVAKWHDVPESWTVTLIETKGTADPSDDVERELLRDAAKGAVSKSGVSRVTVSPEKVDLSTRKSGSDDQYPRLEALSETFERLGVTAKSTSGSPSDSDVPAYRLRINPKQGPLPVELGTFSGRQSEDAIVLEWTTLSESNNDGFEVQVKPEGASSYHSAGFVQGRGTTTEASSYRYTVKEDLDYGEHTFRLRQVDTDGSTSYSKELNIEKSLDRAYDLSKTAPNPVETTAAMELTVREKQDVRITLYDVLGRRVATVHDGSMEPNRTKSMTIDASQLSSGVYFIRVTGESFSETRRMTVVR